METKNFIETLGKDLGSNTSVKNVYGEPIHSGDKTIIPVAKIAYGFGGGFCQCVKRKPSSASKGFKEEEFEGQDRKGEGTGGGGGIYVRPKGIYEVTPDTTKFIPANGTRLLVTGIVIGILVKAIFFSRRRKK